MGVDIGGAHTRAFIIISVHRGSIGAKPGRAMSLTPTISM